jgi:hypothetical protein
MHGSPDPIMNLTAVIAFIQNGRQPTRRHLTAFGIKKHPEVIFSYPDILATKP